MWDLFISHASEDKQSLVRPLASELVKYGVEVWYDEYTLTLGDSLTESIDKGLQRSNFGLLIISPAFFQKRWTDYELKSLLTKEINGGKVILPIWHNVDQEFVASKSLFLADKKALVSSMGVEMLAFEIVKTVRPDIINSYLLKAACRKILPSDKCERVVSADVSAIEGVRHESLPIHLAVASRIFSTLFPIGTYKQVLLDFARDADYDTEFVLWTVITCAYIDGMREFDIAASKPQLGEKIFSFLLMLSLDNLGEDDFPELSDEIKVYLLQAYMKHSQALFPIIQRSE